MKKFFIIVIILCTVLALSSCSTLLYILEEAQETDSQTSDLELDTTSSDKKITTDMPTLPDLDYSDMKLLEDGYEIVEFRTNPDGDTATFIVSGTPLVTRFLAIDTPEMNYDENNPEPYAEQALEYTENILKNADTIILEIDEESDIFDDYDRLLAWVWADGELVNYGLVSQGYAYVKYLYGDYKYNNVLLELESEVENYGIGLWGGNVPLPTENTTNLNTNNSEASSIAISDARNASIDSKVEVTGVVTNIIGNSAFIQDETGGIYVYAKKNYNELEIGNEIQIAGKIAEYNNLLEITDIGDKIITILNTNISTEPKVVELNQLGESLEAQYIRVNNLTIKDIETSSEKGYNIYVTDGNTTGVIRIDRYLSPYPDSSFVSIGDNIDVVGNVAQHMDSYQIMIGSEYDIIK